MYGRVKRIENLQPRFGAAGVYLFVKVRSGPAEWQEEYLLVTEPEAERFAGRGYSYTEVFDAPVGKLADVTEAYGRCGVLVKATGAKSPTLWVLTAHDLEEIRQRVEKNTEDIEANRESWLADLFD